MIAWNFQRIVGTCQFRVPWFGYPCGYSSLTEQNAFGLTDDFDDLYIQKSQPVANGWLLVILDFNTHKTIAQDSYKSHHVHPAQYPDNAV